MCASAARFRVLLSVATLCVPFTACGGGEREAVVHVGNARDAAMPEQQGSSTIDPDRGCDVVEIDGDVVLEREQDFTARFRTGEPYTMTVMLFGGEPVEDVNILGNAYIFGLDKVDALMLAEKYADFYLCSSPGGQEASSYIIPYDLVPATCEIYEQLLAAFRTYDRNVVAGGDRTSLRLEGAPLTLESVTANATGEDVTDQASDQNFHLVTAVEQLTGQSVLAFGTTE
jgi:hypothetical protein